MTRVCWPAMATPIAASSSERGTGRAGEPVARRRPPVGRSRGPGTVRVYAVVEGKTQEWQDAAALKGLPGLLQSDRTPPSGST